MFDHQERFLSPSPSGPGGLAAALTVVISIGDEAADDVILQRVTGGHVLTPRAVSDRGIEVTGNLFLPKSCAVELEVGASSAAFGSAGRPDPVKVTGAVRKVQMIDTAPSYALWVDLDADSVGRFAAWRAALPPVGSHEREG